MQIRGILLIAWAQWPQSVSTADALTTCAERRTHLASALDVITRLEAELEEARRWMSEKALEVMRCELNTTTLQSSGEPPQESARTFRCQPNRALRRNWGAGVERPFVGATAHTYDLADCRSRGARHARARGEKLEAYRWRQYRLWLQLLPDVPACQRLCAAEVRATIRCTRLRSATQRAQH